MDVPAHDADLGVLVVAFGPERYRHLAVHLARSLERHAPTLPRAVVTDHLDDPELTSRFDLLVPLRPELGGGVAQKLQLDVYSPFRRTLFIDADCLVFGPLDDLLDRLADRRFAVVGGPVSDGDWYGDVASLAAAVGAASIPKFNGGIYWFDTEGAAVLRRARELAERYDELGIRRFRATDVADEPLIALAMAEAGVEPLRDDGTTMVSILGFRGWPRLDVLRGRARFTKHERRVTPAIVHFVGRNASPTALNGVFHRREAAKLAMAERGAPTWRARWEPTLRHLPAAALWVTRRNGRRWLGRLRS